MRAFAEDCPDDVEYHGLEQSPELVQHDPRFPHKGKYSGSLKRELQRLIDDAPEVFKLFEDFYFHINDGVYPFEEELFDEVHLNWVLTSPGVTLDVALELLNESLRVLKTGGNLFLTGEVYRCDHVSEVFNPQEFGLAEDLFLSGQKVLLDIGFYVEYCVKQLGADYRVLRVPQDQDKLDNLLVKTVMATQVRNLLESRKDNDADIRYADAFILNVEKYS